MYHLVSELNVIFVDYTIQREKGRSADRGYLNISLGLHGQGACGLELRYPITTNLMTLIVYVNHLLQQECLSQCGLRLCHFRILANLMRQQEAQSITHIARDLHLNVSTITLSVNEIERTGLVVRTYPTEDRRLVLVHVTEEGTEITKKAEEVLAKLVSDLWKPLSPDHKKTLMKGAAKIDVAQTVVRETTQQIRAVTAYANVYLFTLDAFLKAVRKYDLTINEFRILFELKEHHRGISPGALSRILLIRPNEMTKATDGLASHGLLNRSRAQDDRRRYVLEITSAGYELLDRSAPVVDEAFLSGVCLTDRDESAQYLEIAEAIIDRAAYSWK